MNPLHRGQRQDVRFQPGFRNLQGTVGELTFRAARQQTYNHETFQKARNGGQEQDRVVERQDEAPVRQRQSESEEQNGHWQPNQFPT